MHQYRVTKYDPSRRDSSGAYPSDDWTAISDIGRTYAGAPLTEEAYLAVEAAYLKAAGAFLRESDVDTLQVCALENHANNSRAPVAGAILKPEEILLVLRALLREEYWCKLESDLAYIHVGYDYYMYIGVPQACHEAGAEAVRLGLFVESVQSPYASNAA